eukprot:TRINITY_DN57477_c0_g1_i1.p1 TRINITY_DN57477_c0_g1~~TRINITY_DN57477_c0_g1_i1.p1  ORF type:complete len:170 (+),score=44.48 TRINITY_DN57477_c0_g1_i1:31-540(+)
MAPKKKAKADEEAAAAAEAERLRLEALEKERAEEAERVRLAAESEKALKEWKEGIIRSREAQMEQRRGMMQIFSDLQVASEERERRWQRTCQIVAVARLQSEGNDAWSAPGTPRSARARTPGSRPKKFGLDKTPGCPLMAPNARPKCPFTRIVDSRASKRMVQHMGMTA